MRWGIFAKTFERARLEDVLDAVAAYGIDSIQFNFEATGLGPMPPVVSPELTERIRRAAAARGIEISALSGTFNMIHPDPAVVALGLERLEVLADAAAPISAE